MGNITLALLDEQAKAAASKWLREAERATLRAKDLTQQLLTFAKGGEPVRSAVLLADVVREAAQFALHGSSVRCDFEIAPDLRPADVDKGQIAQVVHNLVLNAVQAMPDGGGIKLSMVNETIGTGQVATLPAGHYLRIDITDSGRGIAPEHLARIFEPFFTTKEYGTGLGLATAYSVIQKHRGYITAESVVGAGTTFRLWLPAARIEPATPAPTLSPFEPMKGRVLFMDDEEPIRMMTQALLERLGLDVKVTADGDEAVQEYATARSAGQPYDVVIFDLTVPGAMGGAAAMREILKIDPAARGIVSSGYSSDPVMANFRAHGFRGSVPKPYRIADISRTLREVMNGS
jgi:CheY-like chemotaxis protein